MENVDLKRFICSLIGFAKDNAEDNIVDYFTSALQDQGLEYKDGEIVTKLVDSEDEKIRKMLIDSFTRADMGGEIYGKGVTYKQVIAWLEKQESVGEIVERCKNSWYNEGKIAGMVEGLTEDEKYQQGWHDALEKQGEQKPTDKVEPKFKVGDILVRKKGNGFLYPVIDMDDKYYVIRAFHKPRAIEKKECEEFFKLVRRRENGKLIE